MKEHDFTEAECRRDHTCVLFSNQNDEKGYLLPFLHEGLTKGEHCLFVIPEASVDDWSLELQAFGIDVVKYRQSGALVISTCEDWRRNRFRAVAKARELWEHIEANLSRFPAVRITGDASWAMIPPVVTPDMLCHWEAAADFLYEDQPVKTICLYDLRLHSPSAIRAALRTHSRVVLGRKTYVNPYYEAPRILDNDPHLNHSDADAATIEAMLAALRGPE